MSKPKISIRPKKIDRNLATTIRFLRLSAIYFQLAPSNRKIKDILLGLDQPEHVNAPTTIRHELHAERRL